MTNQLTTVEKRPASQHLYSVIWLHGLGADGHDFAGIVPELNLTQEANIHFIFPHAPVQPVTINGGMKMRAWYDILEMSLVRKVDISGIYSSCNMVGQLIEQEIALGVPSENIVLAGFSQGGAIALHTGLTFPKKLAGIVALSTYLPTFEQLQIERSVENADTALLMAHGTHDPVVDIRSGKLAYTQLIAMHYPVMWHQYPMEHAVCQEEIYRIAEFIDSVLKPASSVSHLSAHV